MNWINLITDLQNVGLSQSEIGKGIGLSQSSVVDVLQGRTKELKWTVGEALIALHATQFPKKGMQRAATRVIETTRRKGR